MKKAREVIVFSLIRSRVSVGKFGSIERLPNQTKYSPKICSHVLKQSRVDIIPICLIYKLSQLLYFIMNITNLPIQTET